MRGTLTITDDIMPRTVLSCIAALCLAALALLIASPAVAQPATTISIPSQSPEIADLLRQGRELETERRWGEATSHYESAVRQFPHDASLKRRFDLTRSHYDVNRRYADRSFCNAVKLMPSPLYSAP